MNTLFAFLASAVGPLALRVVAALGLGVLTFTGVDNVVSTLISGAQNNWGSISADILGLASVAKIPECLGLPRPVDRVHIDRLDLHLVGLPRLRSSLELLYRK